jgi:GxxExxY protein
MKKLIHSDESYGIIGACFNVYNDKGCGFLEAVYQECMSIELTHQRIPHVVQPQLSLHYRDVTLQHTYRPDFICFDSIILEIKAVNHLTDEHRAQLLNYLNATKHELGLLINFGHSPKLEYERLVLQPRNESPECPF